MVSPEGIHSRWSLRAMVPEDVAQVMAIEEASFSAPWTRGIFHDELASPISQTLVVVGTLQRVRDIVGYINFWIVAGEIHLNHIAVRPDLRGRGIASILVEEMFRRGKAAGAFAATLEVRASNTVAIAAYKKCGFQIEGIRPGYYTDTREDAVIMWAYRNQDA